MSRRWNKGWLLSLKIFVRIQGLFFFVVRSSARGKELDKVSCSLHNPSAHCMMRDGEMAELV